MVAVVDVKAPLRTRSPEDERRLEAFERRMAMPILISALLPIILTLAGNDSTVADVVLVVTWFVFVADYVVHQRLVPHYFRSKLGLFDLAVVVLSAPWFLIPGMGNSRVLALARLARLARVVKASGSGMKRLAAQLGQVGIFTGLIVVTCAYVGYGAEHEVNKAFATYGDAVWWAIVTITTVGYGDIYPITTAGRISGVALMVSGVALLGVLAGTLASFFGFGQQGGGASGSGGSDAAPERSADVAALRARLAELDRTLAELQDRLG